MKKILYFASALLTLAMVSSCAMYDTPVDVPETFTIVDENGNKYETDLIATLQGEMGAEVTLGLGVYAGYDIYGVDFGDGKIIVDTVGWHNGGARELGAAEGETPAELLGTTHTGYTTFKGIVAGDGIVKVYGKSDIWYLVAAGGIIPTSFDQEKLQKVVQMQVNGYNTEEIALPQLDYLESFTCNQSPVKTVDVSKCTKLTTLNIQNNSMSKYPTQIENIDLSKNVNLEKLQITGYAASPGKLKKIDLSNNTKLTGMGLYLQFNELEELIIGETTLTTINVMNNKLKELDLTKFPNLKNLYANDNQFTALDFSKLQPKGTINIYNNQLTELNIPVQAATVNASGNKLTQVSIADITTTLNLENNCLTIATLPAKPASIKKISNFKYNNQADMEVAPEGAVLDLSAQASAQGELDAPVATTFTVKAGEATLEAGKDYTIDNGKITFLKSATGVVVEMTTEAFPKLTALKTVPFDVTVSAATEPMIVFSANPTTAWNAPASAETEITSDIATIAGGKIFAVNQQTAEKAMIKNQGGEVAFQCTNNNTFFKIVLDKALQAGDVISIRMQSRTDTDLGLFFAASDTRPNETATSIILPTAEAQAWVDAPIYTVKADDGICGQTTFYAFRATGKSTYFNAFTITRK